MTDRNEQITIDETLTERELKQLNAFREGMDTENEGWLHEMAEYEGKTLSGVISSLCKKGCIERMESDPQASIPPATFIYVAIEWRAYADGMTVDKLERWPKNNADRYLVRIDGRKQSMIYKNENVGWVAAINGTPGAVRGVNADECIEKMQTLISSIQEKKGAE